ncbi:MAG: hypothetical protein ABI076_02395 [Acidobacteriaceae bacterium]
MSTRIAILGMALCIPAAMLAQDTAPPPDAQAPTAQSSNPAGHSMKRHRGNSPENQLKRLTKKLNLTPDQQQQILPILQDRDTQMKTMRDDTSLSQQQRREQGRTLMQNTNQKIEAVLNDTQKQQFEQQNQRRREHMRNHRMAPGSAPGGTPPPPPSSDEQTPTPPPPQQ